MKTDLFVGQVNPYPAADTAPHFGCSRSRAISVLVSRGWWPHPPPGARVHAAADFYVMAAFQHLMDRNPTVDLVDGNSPFNRALKDYLDGEAA